MSERALSSKELLIIRKFAERLDPGKRQILIQDMENAVVESTRANGEVIKLRINGYARPSYHGQHSYSPGGVLLDADHTEIEVVLYADENDRLLELEFIRREEGDIIEPQWNTLRFLW
ncbi:DUF6984 family protein [Nitrospirillum amazonense]|uniref:DUF6984 family protein n=1 Tax=Nitrospirillum amazonense TaxID=28077 RepID=UPI0024122D51|nr:hypothetical protein [Nitrospirillum amazonense]MDG3439367.1 hypothetical protein [Nitrospirillum amazonense]